MTAEKRLKVMCKACHHIMGYVWEDEDGALILTNKDRLMTFDGKWWTDEGAEPVLDMDSYNYSGCSRGGPGCGQAYSWQLREARAELGKARGTGRVVTFAI